MASVIVRSSVVTGKVILITVLLRYLYVIVHTLFCIVKFWIGYKAAFFLDLLMVVYRRGIHWSIYSFYFLSMSARK